jgi:hypothetical protein
MDEKLITVVAQEREFDNRDGTGTKVDKRVGT